MGSCDDLPAKPELLHWERVIRARRDLVTQLCRASVNSAIKEHGVMCRLTATAFAENDPCVRTLKLMELQLWLVHYGCKSAAVLEIILKTQIFVSNLSWLLFLTN
ncbi:hypothetical protein AVEN_199168-1 [Araneus ventricosus]|uniref:Uncharacterized protein n=1 Tax=Araneus ventricosus TaxID=182803 RepID=A0A4Y2PKK9_ARAVE|nr:hypothetical protein AVEN_199168-1 [Araneus ventricosus]